MWKGFTYAVLQKKKKKTKLPKKIEVFVTKN